MNKRRILGISFSISVFGFILYLIDRYLKSKPNVLVSASTEENELINLKRTVNEQDSLIKSLQYRYSTDTLFETVKVTSDGQTVFYSSKMPSGFNKNRLVIEINGDLRLTNEDGYTYDTNLQKLTLTLPGINLEINNEIRFCFY